MAHTDNAIGFWDLDNDADDDSGNGNNGTAGAGITFDTTKAVFDGTGNIALPDNMISSNVATWSGWGVFSSVGGAYYQGLFAIGSFYIASNFGIFSENAGLGTPMHYRVYGSVYGQHPITPLDYIVD